MIQRIRQFAVCMSFTLLVAAGCASLPRTRGLDYPQTATVDQSDDYHGTRISDPYRWLEELHSPQTTAWVKAQNALSQPWLEALPQRAAIKSSLEKLWRYERYGVPRKAGGRYFYTFNDGHQDQAVLYVADSLAATPRVLYDPNKARDDATIAIARFVPSADGRIVAYSTSDGGTDWDLWHFVATDDAVPLPDVLRQTKFWNLSFAADGSGVYYSRYPALPDGRGDDGGRPAIYFHRLGTEQSSDRLVYEITDHPTRVPDGLVTDDGRYLIISEFDGYETNAVKLLKLADANAAIEPLMNDWDALYTVLGNVGDTFFVLTTNAAPRGRVVAVDADRTEPARWHAIVPESADSIESASLVGGRIIVTYVHDAHSVVRVYDPGGGESTEVALPGLGSVGGFNGRADDTETFFSFVDHLRPAEVLRYDIAGNTVLPYREPRQILDPTQYQTRQVFYASRDGTRVPMFIVEKRGTASPGPRPTLLYGYGGFNVSLTPAYKPYVLAWLEMGGVYAEANLRGGGEYGEAWHQAGTREHKQNVFDDFIAAAEYLQREKITDPRHLAIMGRSNGGLLIGAVMLQRPELFAAALPGVGVLDMLRYQLASANARQWSSDFGLSENPGDFGYLRAYSPLHNVVRGRCYPATLITTADRDDRVVPWHSYKFAATLQQAQGCSQPVLIRIETRAGHGAGKPLWMQIDDFADQLAFAAQATHLGAPPAP
ncbi:MAG: prolyl oligopeptidase family serine peptidase [Steroidobacteraceae bacterium]